MRIAFLGSLAALLVACNVNVPEIPPAPDASVPAPAPEVPPPPAPEPSASFGPSDVAGRYFASFHANGGTCERSTGWYSLDYIVMESSMQTLKITINGFPDSCVGLMSNSRFHVEDCVLTFVDGPNLVAIDWSWSEAGFFSGSMRVDGGEPRCYTDFTMNGTRVDQ